MFLYSKIFNLLGKKEQKEAAFLALLILFMSVVDTLGIASIMPFVGLLANPDLIETNSFLKSIYIGAGFSSKEQLLFFTGFVVLSLLLFSQAIKIITIYLQHRFTYGAEVKVSSDLFNGYLRQSHLWFTGRNSSDLSKSILSETHNVIHGTIVPAITIFTQGLTSVFLFTLLVIVDFKIAFIVIGVIFTSYAIMYWGVKNFLKSSGIKRFEANQLRFQIITESFSAFREVKLANLESIFVERFCQSSLRYAWYQAISTTIGNIPRFVFEGIAFGGMMTIILYKMGQGVNLDKVLPIIAVYAFAGYRMLPAAQQIYSAITQIQFSKVALDSLCQDLRDCNADGVPASGIRIDFDSEIKIKNLTFHYPYSKKPALKDVSLTIERGSKIGVIGYTGSGKSSLLDILTGLMSPASGGLEIDGKCLGNESVKNWQKKIAYVSQNIHLSGSNILENIAFGFSGAEIDRNRVRKVAKIAQILDYIENELPDGFETNVGDNGVRLSGGQKQRVGIARALYRKPELLILDEATSGLDTITERNVMRAIDRYTENVTVILIAHRLSILKSCDKIFVLDQGMISAEGSFEQLSHSSPIFRNMLKVGT